MDKTVSIEEIDPEFCGLIKRSVELRNSTPRPLILRTRVFINYGPRKTYDKLKEISGEGILPNRNDPCFCGCGKKFKKCHGRGS